MAPVRHIRGETTVSIVINVTLSMLFFLAGFGRGGAALGTGGAAAVLGIGGVDVIAWPAALVSPSSLPPN